MRRGFTLIELIITIVIMAGIFAVIPRIVFATAKSDRFAMQQDALMQALSMTTIASRLAWDENNTDHLDILQTDSAAYACDPVLRFRPGSYIGANGRMCEQSLTATAAPGAESGESDYRLYDDIDDFDGTDVNASVPDRNSIQRKSRYQLQNSVTYLSDNVAQESGSALTIDLSQSAATAATTAIKRFKSKVRYIGKRGKARNIGAFVYYSTNIGQISLAYRNW